MGRTLLLGVLIGCLLCVDMVTAARGGRGGKGRGVGRKGYSSRMPVLIQHRNPASASYYNHKDVSTRTTQRQTESNLIHLNTKYSSMVQTEHCTF
jgi:hypothetical protein